MQIKKKTAIITAVKKKDLSEKKNWKKVNKTKHKKKKKTKKELSENNADNFIQKKKTSLIIITSFLPLT